MEFDEKSLEMLHLHEPDLEFAYGQKSAHPKDGLFLYGPHSKAKKTREIRIGVIGTVEGVNHFKSWATQIKKRVEVPPPGKTEKADRLHLANFPGIEEAFGISFEPNEFAAHVLDRKVIDRTTRIINLHEAVSKTVELYVEEARRHVRKDERAIDIWVLVVPEFIFERCKPGAKRTGLPMEKGDFGKKQRARSDLPLLSPILDQTSEEVFDDAPDFHRQVKASFLTLAPTQLLRETTWRRTLFLTRQATRSAGHRIEQPSRGTLRLAYITRRSRRRLGNCLAYDLASATSGLFSRTFRTTRMIMPAVRRRCF